MELKELLLLTVKEKASDLHLTENSPPVLRIDGSLIFIDKPPLNRDDLKKMIYAVLTEGQIKKFEEEKEAHLAILAPGCPTDLFF